MWRSNWHRHFGIRLANTNSRHTAYEYDLEGNLKLKTPVKKGNIEPQPTNLEYDFVNRLTTITSGPTKLVYKCDALRTGWRN